ncbi:hypothetical protein [Streptomyces atroolivaceus]|uniref:hypothetical protein n=1 Tax=Streptomyces atroolivaceus TaxID=66869 RepID=UPI00362AFE2A
MTIPLTGTTPPLQSDSPAPGRDQTAFRCGRCGAERTATTEDSYRKAAGAHRDAHAVWDRLNSIERDGIASILRTILSAPDLAVELLALTDGSR